jgi:hypothetical protein
MREATSAGRGLAAAFPGARGLSCRTFNAKAVRIQLHVLAYNCGNFLRTPVTLEPIQDWCSRAYARSSSTPLQRSSATVATSLSKCPKLPSNASFRSHLAADRETASASDSGEIARER